MFTNPFVRLGSFKEWWGGAKKDIIVKQKFFRKILKTENGDQNRNYPS